jgi:hypothetical protein
VIVIDGLVFADAQKALRIAGRIVAIEPAAWAEPLARRPWRQHSRQAPSGTGMVPAKRPRQVPATCPARISLSSMFAGAPSNSFVCIDAGPFGDTQAPMQEPLARRLADDATPAQVAAAVFAMWEEIDDALSPILGAQGVVALYRRAVHLAGQQHAWLSGRDEGVRTDTGPAVLKSVLAQRSSTEAAEAGCVFLNAFHGLLASLIGPSLTARLLRSVWENFCSGAAAQDT